MPIHQDDPLRQGNLSDEEYYARQAQRVEQTGDEGLHIIPQHYIDAALAGLEAGEQQHEREGPVAAFATSSPITYDASSWLTNYGPFGSGRPWGRVLHSLECNPVPGIARELSAPGGYLDGEGLAPHGMSDPTQRVRACSTRNYSGHVGPRANPHVVGYEVSGRAANTRAQWLDGGNQQAALESDARLIAWDCVQDGWSREEIRMLSGAQIQQNFNGGNRVRGFLDHNDVSEFIGGTSHWDPGPGFPHDWFLDRVRAYYDEFKGITPPKPQPPVSTDWWDTVDAAQAEALMRKVVTSELDARGIKKDLASGVTGQPATHGQYQIWTDTKAWLLQKNVEALMTFFKLPKAVVPGPPKPPVTPPATTEKYTVKAGDTLSSIATARKTTVDNLKKLNPTINPDVINVGDVLTVPKA